MKRMADVTHVAGLTTNGDLEDDPGEITQSRRGKRIVAGHEIPRGVEVYEVNGPFFFGAADKIKDVLGEIAKPPKFFILRMRNVPAIDATGLHALDQMAKKCRHQGTKLILTELNPQPLRALVRAGIGNRDNLAKTLEIALERVEASV
jgi:SulP family sulfate permease